MSVLDNGTLMVKIVGSFGVCSRNFPGKNTGVGCCSLLQGIFSTQELNLGLPHYRWNLYCLSHQGSHDT